MAPRKVFAPELFEKAKYLYEQTLAPVHDITAMIGVSKSGFYKRAKEEGWKPRRVASAHSEFARAVIDSGMDVALPAPPNAAQAAAMAGPLPAQPTDREALALRLQNAVDSHIAAIQRVLDLVGPKDHVETERSARTLAVIGRTLREISTLLKPDEVKPLDEAANDTVPVDIDEFREALALRIEAFVAGQRALESAGVFAERSTEHAGET